MCRTCGDENPDRARFCLSCGAALDEARTGPAAEVRRFVSVIFADMVGSTALGETLDPEALRAVTGRYFTTMRAAVERHGGTVEKFIGDAVVAVFGVPRVREDDALRAVRAAVEMRAALRTLNAEFGEHLAVSLQLRIGVNSGEVVVGEPRAGGSVASGDAMNVAARLEQAAAPGEILVGEATARLVRDYADLEPVAPLSLKGKSRAVPAWRVGTVAPPETRRRGAGHGHPFVGRDAQIRLLDEVYRRAVEERTCQLVTVLGHAGIGKSRLAEEWVAGIPNALVLQGRCLAYGQGVTFWPLRQAVLAGAALAGDETVADAEWALLRVLAGTADREQVVSRLLSVAGFSSQDTIPEDVPWAVRLFLEQLGAARPVVLVVDDLHWAEPGLLDVLEHVADWSREVPIVILGLARPEFYEARPMWGGGKLNAATTLLSELDDKASAALLADHALPRAVTRSIIDSAGGNPLFVEQLVATLVDEGHAAATDGVVRWVANAPETLDLRLPPSIGVLLAARIDRLDEDERAVLGCAAVIGTVFYVDAVTEVTGLPPEKVRGLLGGLMRKELLRPAVSDIPGLRAYRFLHVLLRDAAYEGLAKAVRAQWHEQVAGWLAGLAHDLVPDQLVGTHLADAYEYRRALGLLGADSAHLARRAAERLAAAGRRLELSDAAAAAALLQRAVDLLEPQDPHRGGYLLSLAEQCLELGEMDRARSALDGAGASTDPRHRALARVLRCRLTSLTGGGRVEDSERIVLAAIAEFEKQGDDAALARALPVLAELSGMVVDYVRANELLERAVEHARRAGDWGCVARARSFLAVYYLFGPTPAEDVITNLDKLVEQSGTSPRVRAEAEQVTCVMHAMCGRFAEARAVAAAAKADLAAVGQRIWLANIAQSTGYLEELAGDLDAAELEYERSTEALRSLGERAFLSTVAGLHARLLARRRRFAAAAEALALARESGSPDDLTTQSLIVQAELLLAAGQGDVDRARTLLAVPDPQDVAQVPDDAARVHETAALACRWLGDHEAERQHLQETRRLALVKGNVVRAAAALTRLSELPVGGGSCEESRAAIEK